MLKNFISNESGAVTVDWVVLTAALVGLGLAVMSVVSSGVGQLSNDINDELTGMGTLSFDFSAGGDGTIVTDDETGVTDPVDPVDPVDPADPTL